MSSEATPVDVTDIAQNLPIVPSPLIPRDNLLDTIESAFNQGFEAIVVEAAESLGKTTLLYLAAKKHQSNCCYIYVRGTSVYSYHPATVRADIVNQLCWVMNGVRHPDNVPADDSSVRQYIFDLTRRLARARQHFYFILDGLDELPDSAPQISEILDLLPFGNTWFRFLLSGRVSRLKRVMPPRLRVKDFPITPFSFPETRDFLHDLKLDETTVRDFHISSGGKPGHLSTIRRLISSGIPIDKLVDQKEIRDLFEMEWGKTLETNASALDLVRLIALARHKLSISDLATLTKRPEDTIRSQIISTNFLVIDSNSNEVTIVSHALARFLQEKLKQDEASALRLLADHLLRIPETARSRELIPEYLSATNQKDSLISYLGHDYFLAGLRDAQSLMYLKEQATLGVSLSDQLKSPDALRCTLLANILSSLFSVTAAKEELVAAIALGDYEHASAIASSANLPEDRLLLLAAVARARQQKGMEPEQFLKENLIELVTRLSEQPIDPEKALAISSELFPVLPDHALQLVKASSSKTNAESSSFDWALAKLSFDTLTRSPRASVNSTAELFRERTEDKNTRSVISMLTLFLAPRSATEVLKQVGEITDPADQLLVLRLWCEAHPRSKDAISVTEYALDLALRATSTTVNAGIYRGIAAPVPHATDINRVRKLVGAFDSQRPVYEKLGPIEEVMRLELRLSEAESIYSIDDSVDRLLNVYAKLEARIPEWASRATFYAELAVLLERLAGRAHNQDLLDIRDATQKEIAQALDALLKDCAEHADILRDVVSNLAECFPERAVAIAQRLNTQRRRDVSTVRAIERIVRFDITLDRIRTVTSAAALIEHPRLRDAACAHLVDALSRKNCFDIWEQEAVGIRTLVQNMQGSVRRARALGRLLLALPTNRHQLPDELKPDLLFDSIKASLAQIDRPWLQVRAGFEITAFLAARYPTYAQELQKATREFRQREPFQSERSSSIYCQLIDLSIRAYKGLVEAKSETEKDLNDLKSVIDSIPSFGDRAMQWSSLALALFATNKPDQARNIVFRNLKTCIDQIGGHNQLRRYEIASYVAPSLWLANRQTADDIFDSLPDSYRDDAYSILCSYLLTKTDPGDPYSWKQSASTTIDFNDGLEVFELLCKIREDSRAYWTLDDLLLRAHFSRKRAAWSRDQIEALANKLEKLFLPTFPRTKDIQHDGYKILVNAWLAKLRDTRGAWEALAHQAKQLPNVSDVVFVLSHLAQLLPSSLRPLKRTFVAQAIELVPRIPSTTDQIDRYATLATSAEEIDPQWAKQITRSAYQLSTTSDDMSETKIAEKQQLTLLNIAYSLDKEFANSLAKLLSDDPAKSASRSRAQSLLSQSNLESSLLNEKSKSFDIASQEDIEALPNSAWQCLGAMNAGRALPVHAPRMNALIKISAQFDFASSYPVLAFIIENQRRMYAKNPQGAQTLRRSFETLIRSAQFAEHAVHVISKNPYRHITPAGADSDQIVIGEGDSDKAKRFIEDWISAHITAQYLICDPYFSPEDLPLLLSFARNAPTASIHILTGEEGLVRAKVAKPFDDSYRRAWRQFVSDAQDPPESLVTIVGADPDGNPPFHDRWILCELGGIRVGTSFNSIGRKLSEMSMLPRDQSLALMAEVEPYIAQKRRQHLGQKLRYVTFSL